MSSTNRGGVRADVDYYPTPAFAVHRLLERLQHFGGYTGPGSRPMWLEPTAGDGAIIRAAQEQRPCVAWTAVELREACRAPLEATGAAVIIGNFLDYGLLSDEIDWYDAAILNPPFSSALPIVRRCLHLARQVAVLERLNWLESAERHAFFRAEMPDVYVVGRIDFDGRGGDSIPYAWFVWPERAQRARRSGAIELLDQTPVAERVRGALPPTVQPRLL